MRTEIGWLLLPCMACIGQASGLDPGEGADAAADLDALQAVDGAVHFADSGTIVESCPPDRIGDHRELARAFVLGFPADPAQLTTTRLEPLVVCAGHDDWFSADLPPAAFIQVSAVVPLADPLPELSFFREEWPVPEEHFGGGGSGAGEHQVSSTVWRGEGRMLFRVSTARPSLNYTLEWTTGQAIALSRCNGPMDCDIYGHECRDGLCDCEIDALEPNDDAGAASRLERGRSYDLAVCASDDDWFSFDARAGEPVFVALSQSGGGFSIGVAIYDRSALSAPLVSAGNSASGRPVRFDPPRDGEYLLRLRAAKFYATGTVLELRSAE